MDEFPVLSLPMDWDTSANPWMNIDFLTDGGFSDVWTEPIISNDVTQPFGLSSRELVPAKTRQPCKISREQWNQVKNVIYEQYIVQKFTLNELIRYMEQSHCFFASKQQYARKLKEWGFEKNQKDRDWHGVVRALKRRKTDFQDTDVYLSGRLITSKQIKKEMSRRDRPTLQSKFTNDIDMRGRVSPPTPDGLIIERHSIQSMYVSPRRLLPWFDMIDCLSLLSSEMNSRPLDPPHEDFLNEHMEIDRRNLLATILRSSYVTPATSQLKDVHELVAQLTRRLLPVSVERVPGDLEGTLIEIFTTRNTFRMCLLLSSYITYLCTNRLAKDSMLSAFVGMLKKYELDMLLRQIVEMDHLTGQVFTNVLFYQSVAERDLSLLQQVALRTTDIDSKLHSCQNLDTPRNALRMAIEAGDMITAKFLLSSGSNPNQCYCEVKYCACRKVPCFRPIDLAAERRESVELVEYLLDRDAQFDRDKILASVIKNGATTDLIGKLIKSGASIRVFAEVIPWKDDKLHSTRQVLRYINPLTAAIRSGRIDIVEQLIRECLYSPNAPNTLDWTMFRGLGLSCTDDGALCFISPLICSILTGSKVQAQVIDVLIDAGANVNECICGCLNMDSSSEPLPTDFLGDYVKCKWSTGRDPFRDVASPLQAAACVGNEDMVRELVHLGASPDSCHGTPALIHSVWNTSVSMTEFLLESGADPNACDLQGYPMTPLMLAVALNNIAIIELLLGYGASSTLKTRTPYDQDFLVRLYVSQYLARTQLTVGMNDKSYPSANSNASLQMEISLTLNCIRQCLTVLVNTPSSSGFIPPALFEAVLRDPHGTSLLRTCLEGGSDPSRPVGSNNWSPIVLALNNPCRICIEGKKELLEKITLLLAYGVKIDLIEFSRILAENDIWHDAIEQVLLSPNCLAEPLWTFAHKIREAVKRNDAGKIHQILPAVLSAMKRQTSGFMMSKHLCHCIYVNSFHGSAAEESTQVLFGEGTYINSLIDVAEFPPRLLPDRLRRSVHITPLHLLLGWTGQTKKHEDICHLRLRLLRFLIDAGSDVNRATVEQNEGGWSPLQLACTSGGCVDEIRFIIEANAEINAPAPSIQYGKTALQAAAYWKNLEVVEYLVTNGADVNAPAAASAGATALQFAAARGYFRIMQILIETGADIDAPPSGRYNRTAIELAAENGRLDCLHYLLDKYNGRRPISEVCGEAARYARRRNHHIIADCLSRYSLDMNNIQPLEI